MKYLTVLVIIAFVASVAADDEWKPANSSKFERVRDECIKDGVPTNEEVGGLEDKKEVHEFVLCIVKQIGTFTEEGGFNEDRVVAQTFSMLEPSDKLRNDIGKCLKSIEENATPAVRAYQGVKCIVKATT